MIECLSQLNTTPEHGKRGRRVEYTIGWPVDERTLSGIDRLHDSDWGTAVDTEGDPDPAAQVADLTGILCHGPDGDRLASWPADMRVIARRTPRPAGKPATLGEHPDWEYGTFVTNTPAGRSSSSMPATVSRPTSKTGSSNSRPAAPVTCPRSTTAATPPGCSWPPWPPR